MERVTGAQISRLTGKHWNTIKRKLTAIDLQPIAHEGPADLYDSTKALAAVYADPGSQTLDLATERAKLAREQTAQTALKSAVLRRELAPVALLEQALGAASAQAAAIMEAIPGLIKRRMPRLTQAEIDIVRRELAKAANAIADAQIDFTILEEDDADGRDTPRSDEEHPKGRKPRAGAPAKARAAARKRVG